MRIEPCRYTTCCLFDCTTLILQRKEKLLEEKEKFKSRTGNYRLDEVHENFSNLDTCSESLGGSWVGGPFQLGDLLLSHC